MAEVTGWKVCLSRMERHNGASFYHKYPNLKGGTEANQRCFASKGDDAAKA